MCTAVKRGRFQGEEVIAAVEGSQHQREMRIRAKKLIPSFAFVLCAKAFILLIIREK
jgi:hypothetical protein